jgi:tetratricopeptide (TPR) repeat protein
MAGPVGPMWFDPAPPGYPWSMLMVPVNITTKAQAELLVDKIKEVGNHRMKTGNHYDALWKYNHALVLCRDHKLAGQRVSVISSNCAQACLQLKYYLDAFSHASDAINSDPASPILYKAFYRRAEASRLVYQDMARRGDPLVRFPGTARALDDSIRDYCGCFCLRNTHTKSICEAIILAVDNSIPLQFVFVDGDVNCGAPTKVLQELLERQDTKHAHLHFLLHKIPFQAHNRCHFDCSSIQFSVVCKKSLGRKLLTTLLSYGMPILPQDVARAVELLPDTKSGTLDVIAANCKGLPSESLSLAYVAAERSKKPQLLECLKKRGAAPPVPPQEKVCKFKSEGNAYYRSGEYQEALARYYRALPLCQQHKLEEEESRIRGNCAQACLLLELYRDAFDHANECLRLDPESAKGYYRRAEALKRMLENPDWSTRVPDGKTFSDVVEDYFQSHRKAENVKLIYQAIVVATNHDCTKSLPNLTDDEVASGLATRILVELVQRKDSQQKHFSALFFTLLPPERFETGIDLSSLRVTYLLQEKSITSSKLIQRLITLGMRVNESDVASAVQILREQNHKKVLQLLAKECARTRKSTFTSACQEAIKAKKLEFVSCLIENGGAPDVEDLKDLTGWPRANVHPVIDGYMQENARPRKSRAPERSEEPEKREEPPPGLPDRASALITANHSHSIGEALRNGGKPSVAERKFQEALAVCVLYNFKEELNEVCYSLAQLYLQSYKRYDTAYDYCTKGLSEYPTAKVCIHIGYHENFNAAI